MKKKQQYNIERERKWWGGERERESLLCMIEHLNQWEKRERKECVYNPLSDSCNEIFE